MATVIILPKLGNSVESSIIVRWLKNDGDRVAEGEPICEVETDKTTMEVASPGAGVLLERFFQAGDDVPVLTTIAAIGEPGEDISRLRPGSASAGVGSNGSSNGEASPAQEPAAPAQAGAATSQPGLPDSADAAQPGISPRARHLAERMGLALPNLPGTGPGGRIIERDVQAALAAQPSMTPLARAMVEKGSFVAPPSGTGARGRITSRDLQAAMPPAPQAPAAPADGEQDVQAIPLTRVRRIIGMLSSLQTTAQLTLNASADARPLLDYRKRLKASPEAHGLRSVTINDLILFVVARTLVRHPDLNALFVDSTVTQHTNVHLAVAVDTPRGLVVPVIRNANTLSLRQISQEAGRLAKASQEGRVSPDELNGGTFTVTNLGSLGIESFTPILNPPQVAILGVGSVNLKPVEVDGEVAFVPHLGLSLTINHQVVDGAPGARFLQALSGNIAELDLLLAL